MGKIVRVSLLRPLALSTVLLMATAPAALALDAQDFASKITKIWSSSAAGITITLGPATVSGNDVSFAGFTVSAPQGGGEPLSNTIKLDFSGVAEQPDGSYTADALTLPDVDTSLDEKSHLSIKDIALHHLFIPSGKAPSIVDGSRLFADASIGPLSLTVAGVEAVKLDGLTVNNGFKPSQSDASLAEISSTGSTSGLSFDMSGSTDKEALAQAKALGLVTTTGKMLETVDWTLSDGHLNLSELSLGLDKVGKLKFAVDITGYTPQFLQTLSKAAQTMSASANSGNTQAATAMLLASLQSIFLNSASVRYDDAAITTKLLDIGAKQAGTDRPTFISALVSQIPAQMNGDDPQVPVQMVQTVQAAMRAYLTDPHSFEVKLAPKAPLGVLGMVAAFMAPNSVADQVGLKILVNDKEITPEEASKETGVAPPSSGDGSSSPDDSSSNDSSAAPDDSNPPATSGDDETDNNGASDDSSGGDNSRLDSKHNH